MDVDEAAFAREVLEASQSMPVLVDFWAPWCAPCRTLGPLLERLEIQYAGRFKLVKVDSDANGALAARYQVRSIPYVVAFSGGAVADSFVGALPERQLREFIERVAPAPAERMRRDGLALVAAGQTDAGAALLRAALAQDAELAGTRLDLAELLLDQMPPVDAAKTAEVAALLEAAGPADRADSRAAAMQTRLASLRDSATLAAAAVLRDRIAAEPRDLAARFDLARRCIAERDFGGALEQLTEIVARDRKADGDAARRLMLSVFDLAADDAPLVSSYRRRLSALINR
ncbi:MAG: tetratricopeptide repeat protein [Gammaproteobacteria bacterium]|nr:tetratricopeptide repeat protein [Gammaproteobacteria bacterium]